MHVNRGENSDSPFLTMYIGSDRTQLHVSALGVTPDILRSLARDLESAIANHGKNEVAHV